MKRVLVVLSMLTFVICIANAQIKLVAIDTNEPVVKACVFNEEDGAVLGMTDFDGNLPEKAKSAKRLSIRHINYKTKIVETAQITDGKIYLEPDIHRVAEVKVVKQDADFIRIKTYCILYSVINDKPASVRESIINLYYNTKNLEGKPSNQIMSEAIYRNKKSTEGEVKMLQDMTNCSDPTLFSNFNLYKEYSQLKSFGVKKASLKRGGIMYMNEDKVNKICEIVIDSFLSDKPFKVPLLGFSFGNIYESNTYDVSHGTPKPFNLQSMAASFRTYHNKTKGFVDNYSQMYVLDMEYISKEEKKNDKKLKKEKFVRPEGVPEIDKKILDAMTEMEEEK